MKNLSVTFAMVLFTAYASAQLTRLYESDAVFRAPESIVFDSISGTLYVSNYTAPLKEGDNYGVHSISRIDLEGTILDQDFITGLSSPTGICIRNRKLYIVERFGIVEYDLDNHKISRKYYIKTTDFLNDVTADPEGTLYVTVSGTSKIYRIKEGRAEVWLEHDSIANPNGILFHKGKLLVGTTSDGCLKSVDPVSKEIQKIARLGERTVDGIRPCGDDVLVSLFEGNLFRVSLQGKVSELLNTREEKIFLADFEYIESMGLLFIPALWNNKVLIYKYIPD